MCRFLFIFILGFSRGEARPVYKNTDAPQGGARVSAMNPEPGSLNPILTGDGNGVELLNWIIEPLLNTDFETNELIPALAESWTVAKDGMTFTFTLRRGAKFQNGEPVTADDVKFSFDVMFDDRFGGSMYRPYYEHIARAEVINSQTVRFFSKQKYFANFRNLATMMIIPKSVYGDPLKTTKTSILAIGSGPYRLKSFERGSKVILERNSEWWGHSLDLYKGFNNFQQLIFRFVKNEQVQIEMLKRGEIDYLPNPSIEQFVLQAVGPEWGHSLIKVQAENRVAQNWRGIVWNLRRPLFQDRRVRQALAHLFNRQEIIDKFRFGLSILMAGPWDAQSPYADPATKPLAYDPTQAAQLLKQAGWSDHDKDGVLDKIVDGKKVDLAFTIICANPEFEKYLTLYQADLRKVGVRMEIQLSDWNTLMHLASEKKFDGMIMGFGGETEIDPKAQWHSSSITNGSNLTAYANTRVDHWIEQATTELDEKKRQRLVQKVYRQVAEDAPYLFLWTNRYSLYMHSNKIHQPQATYLHSIGEPLWWYEP